MSAPATTPVASHNQVLVVATLGGVDAGKSSLTGVLTSNVPDDGKGSARQHVLRHEEERVHGRTSDPSLTYVGFDAAGKFIPITWNSKQQQQAASAASSQQSKGDVGELTRTVNLLDCCGHLRYLSTSIARFVATRPHFALVMVDYTSGYLNPMTLHHLNLCCAMQCRVVLVLTKTDAAPKAVSQATLQALKTGLSRFPTECFPQKLWMVRSPEDTDKLFENNMQLMKHYTPIFAVSSVTMKGVDLLQRFLYLYPVTDNSPTMRVFKHAPSTLALFYLDRSYTVRGIGSSVFSGFVVHGTIHAPSEVWFGPFSDGRKGLRTKGIAAATASSSASSDDGVCIIPVRFVRVRVKSLQVNHETVTDANTAQCTAAAVTPLRHAEQAAACIHRFRPGHVLVTDLTQFSPETFGVCMRFELELLVTHHATTIQKGYQCVCHTQCVRQSVRILSIDDVYDTDKKVKVDDTSVLRSGYHARITVEWMRFPELLICGSRVVLREGEIRAIGRVARLHLSDVRIETT
jgi:elongation factor 1-alpha